MILADVTRKQAFLTHLTVSTMIFCVLLYLIVFQWYPEFYFTLDGGLRAITTIFFVDIVLGPGLTLLVFKPGKKALRFDMTLILLFQISALTWGTHSVYSERSGTAVFYLGKISCVSHNDTSPIDMASILKGPSDKQRLSFLQAPDTLDGLYDFVKEPYLQGTSEVYYYADKIVALDEAVVSSLDRYELRLERLREENTSYADIVAAYIKQNPGHNDVYMLIPISCRYGNAIAVYEAEKLRIVNLIDVATRTWATDTKVNVMKGRKVIYGDKKPAR